MSLSLALLLLCWVFCTSCGICANESVGPESNELFELSIIHFNDFHARFVQTDSASNSCHKGKERECIGGLARISTASRQLLRDRPNAIFLNAGDYYQGTMWYNIHKWNATAYFMNKLHFDVMTLGNHEFDDDVAGLVPFLHRLRAPVVVSNVDTSEEPTMQGLYTNSTVIVRSNRTIGVIGVITKTTKASSITGKLKFLDEVESINDEAKRLKSRRVNIIIVLSHVGLDVDRIIAANCPEVDVIVGGHSHTFLYSGKPPFNDNPADNYPVVVNQNETNRTVLIVQAQAFTRYLGNLTIKFDDQGEVANWEGNPIFMGSFVEEDPEMLKELKPWSEAVNEAGKKVVGETQTFLNGTCRSGECNMANLITDAMVHWYQRKAESSEHWTYVAIGCINSGGIRANISPGTITLGDLAAVLPFEDTWNVVELKGDDLYNVLEESVSCNCDKDKFQDPGFLQWSGVKVVYNFSMPAWSRIQNLTVRCQACKVPEYEPLNREKWYRVVMRSYIIEGKDERNVVAAKHRNRQSGPIDIRAFEDYVKTISPFTYERDQRVQFVK